MIEELKQLIELQQIDSRILDKKRLIEDIPSKLTAGELPLAESKAALNTLKEKIDSFEKKKRDKEKEIDDINEKIKKLKIRTSEIKTNKEYQAHLKEIESAEKERYSTEDEILVLMEEIDTSLKELKKEETKFKNEQDKIEVLKKELEVEMSEAEKELLPLKEARARIVDSLDEEIYNEYMQVLEASNALAVVEAKDEICTGCNMNIPPQLFVEIKKNEKILNCPQCRRVLFYKNTS
jgi:predicted  nucleic acid-binding Zn-ribbon protein